MKASFNCESDKVGLSFLQEHLELAFTPIFEQNFEFTKDAIAIIILVLKAFKYQVFKEGPAKYSFSPFFILIADSSKFPKDCS